MRKKAQSTLGKNLTEAWRHARRVVVFVVGGSIILLGTALLVLPGPATVVIPVGLAILATEFVWARRLLRRARSQGKQLMDLVVANEQESSARSGEADGGSDGESQCASDD